MHYTLPHPTLCVCWFLILIFYRTWFSLVYTNMVLVHIYVLPFFFIYLYIYIMGTEQPMHMVLVHRYFRFSFTCNLFLIMGTEQPMRSLSLVYRESERERERECVCVCVCVRERERERERDASETLQDIRTIHCIPMPCIWSRLTSWVSRAFMYIRVCDMFSVHVRKKNDKSQVKLWKITRKFF